MACFVIQKAARGQFSLRMAYRVYRPFEFLRNFFALPPPPLWWQYHFSITPPSFW
jgi:hypothetical protein